MISHVTYLLLHADRPLVWEAVSMDFMASSTTMKQYRVERRQVIRIVEIFSSFINGNLKIRK